MPYFLSLNPKLEPARLRRNCEKRRRRSRQTCRSSWIRHTPNPQHCATKSKVVVQSTLPTPRPNRFTRGLPPRGSRDPFRLAEGGALPYEGDRHCPGFSFENKEEKEQADMQKQLDKASPKPQPLFGVSGSRFRISSSGLRVPGSGFRIWRSGFRVPGVGFRASGSAFQGVGGHAEAAG